MKKLFFLPVLFVSLPLFALEAYQGEDMSVEHWRCGAPLVEVLRESDPDELLNDPSKTLKLKESLFRISTNNMKWLKNQLGELSNEEQAVVDLIKTKFSAPIVHRTNVASSRTILESGGMVSSAKRKGDNRTPNIEQELFSGHDCLFVSVAPPYGTPDYGPTLFRFRNKQGFAWASFYSGYKWVQENLGLSVAGPATFGMKQKFARQVITNNDWDEHLALQIVSNVRKGTSIRGKGAPYKKETILHELLSMNTASSFWKKVVAHRLAYLEGHYTDNVPVDSIQFVQFRTVDEREVHAWRLPFDNTFIQFFNRNE